MNFLGMKVTFPASLSVMTKWRPHGLLDICEYRLRLLFPPPPRFPPRTPPPLWDVLDLEGVIRPRSSTNSPSFQVSLSVKLNKHFSSCHLPSSFPQSSESRWNIDEEFMLFVSNSVHIDSMFSLYETVIDCPFFPIVFSPVCDQRSSKVSDTALLFRIGVKWSPPPRLHFPLDVRKVLLAQKNERHLW